MDEKSIYLLNRFMDGTMSTEDKAIMRSFVDDFFKGRESEGFIVTADTFNQEFQLYDTKSPYVERTSTERAQLLAVFAHIMKKCAEYDRTTPMVFENDATRDVFGDSNTNNMDLIKKDKDILFNQEKNNIVKDDLYEKNSDFDKGVYRKDFNQLPTNPIGDGEDVGDGDDGAPAAAAMHHGDDFDPWDDGPKPPPPPSAPGIAIPYKNENAEKPAPQPEADYPELDF